MKSEYRSINQRIFLLVIRSFIAVVLPILLLILIAMTFTLVRNPNFTPFNHLSLINRLEGYYIGHGSWDGITAAIFQRTDTEFNEYPAYLLDAAGQVIINNTPEGGNPAASLFDPNSNNVIYDIFVNGEKVGSVIIDAVPTPTRLLVIGRIILPVGLFSLFMLAVATGLGFLLSRRIVTPLAEVIAAAREVTAGKLDARVKVQGTQDLLALTESFNQMADSLERNDHERRDLFADIAHELRTPISAIRGRLEGMIDGIYPADEKHISQTLTATYLLESLVEDLRLLALAEIGELQFEKKEIDLRILAGQTLEMLSAEALEKNIRIELMTGSGSFTVHLDAQRTEQVVSNLIENALRYVPENGKVWISLEKDKNNVILSVSDNGTGIPEEELPFIFNRFWRKDKSRARHSGGSGLGLAIAKQFTEAQGGSISAENLPGGGLKVIIKFPALEK